VDGALCPRVVVELDVECFEAVDEDLVVVVGQLAGAYSAFECFYLYRGAVFVAAAYHYDVFAFEAEIAGVDVRGQQVCECSEMGSIVDVGPCAADYPSSQSSLILWRRA